MERNELIEALEENDSNGCYSDEDCIAEGMEPLTNEQLEDLYIEQFEQDVYDARND